MVLFHLPHLCCAKKNRPRCFWYVLEKDDANTIKKRCSLSVDGRQSRKQSSVQTRDVTKNLKRNKQFPEEEERKEIRLRA